MIKPPLSARPATYGDRYALARIILDATFSAFRGRVPDACLDWLRVEQSALNWGRNFIEGELPPNKRLLVAEVARSDVIGLAMTVTQFRRPIKDAAIAGAYRAELISLQVDPAWQRHGAGRLLLRHTAYELLNLGETSLLVRVLRDNPNVAFYERLGARRLGAQPYNWEGYETEEFIYAWDDLKTLT